MIIYEKLWILCYFYDFTLKMTHFMLFYDFMLAGTPVYNTHIPGRKNCVQDIFLHYNFGFSSPEMMHPTIKTGSSSLRPSQWYP